jgi:nicotinamidase-related amidase
LRERDTQHLIVAGCMTEYCVDTTVRRAVSLGFDVTLAADGHGTWNSPTLNAGQIIDHHNRLLDQFSAGHAAVTVTSASAVAFS